LEPEQLRIEFGARVASDEKLWAEHQDRADSFEATVARQRSLQRLLWDEGWTRWGWPEQFGGYGGTVRHRAVVYEQLALAGIGVPEPFQIVEVAGSAMINYAPQVAAEHVARAVRGDEVWSLGFSEPDSGSDLGSLRTQLSAGENPGQFVVSGHKTWNGFAQLADFLFTLCRTEELTGDQRSLAVALVDLRSPGVTRRPIMAITGRNEYAEVFLDSVSVPADHVIGGLDEGWTVIGYLMQYERGTYAWPRQARLHHRLGELVAQAPESLAADVSRLGQAYLDLLALRLKCRQSLRSLAVGDGGGPGSVASADKLLLVRAETEIANLARDVLDPDIELSDEPDAQLWRHDYLYARALAVFGGTNEVQRNIVAERVLGLPRERAR
jgi:acyl-CoA dehydrogenase